jgi:hypothetical protein
MVWFYIVAINLLATRKGETLKKFNFDSENRRQGGPYPLDFQDP